MLNAGGAADCVAAKLGWRCASRIAHVQQSKSGLRSQRRLWATPSISFTCRRRLGGLSKHLQQRLLVLPRSGAAGGSGAASAELEEQHGVGLLLETHSDPFWTSGIRPADILIVDATNRACVAAADAKLHRHVGVTLQSSFADWLEFLREIVQPSLCVAVFDAPRVRPDGG